MSSRSVTFTSFSIVLGSRDSIKMLSKLCWIFSLVSAVNVNCQSCLDNYDFVIVGGGTAGLTVANRLSELPEITVAVIEAGGEVFNNPNVTSVDGFTLALGTPIDWQYISTNQSYASDQTIAYHSGKALGGTTTVNGKQIIFYVIRSLILARNDICPS